MAHETKKMVKKISQESKSLAKKVWRDPVTKEYVQKQKNLARATLKKAIRKVEKSI